EKGEKFFLFVCGGPIDGKDPTLRLRFLSWSERELPEFIVIRAEEAYKRTRFHTPSRPIDLASFESLIGGIADIVVIFPESPGSISEAGFFCNSPGIPAKMIVANDSTYRGEPSFLNLGPLRKIDSKSDFSPTIDIRLADPTVDFAVIKKKLEAWKKVARRKRFAYAPYKDLKPKQRLFVILEMLHILRLVTLEDLRYAVKEIFGPASLESVGRMLSILVGAKFVGDVDGRYSLAKDRETMLAFDAAKKDELIALVTEYYQNHRPELYDAVRAWASS
ncbi:MAG: retron St85 family effector protein, partial [Candidatus Acidiferrales bacterium]